MFSITIYAFLEDCISQNSNLNEPDEQTDLTWE